MQISPHRVTISPRRTQRATPIDNDRPEQHSVLLIHGQPGSSLIWTRVLPLLRAYGLRAVTVERRDEGHSDGEAVDQLPNAATLAGLLDEYQRSPAIIVGHSLGAGLALALAATAPRHVRAVVLVAPVAGPQSISITDSLLAAPVLGPSLAWLGFRVTGLTHGSAWRRFTVEQRRLVTESRRIHNGLSRLTCPIFIVAGTSDPIAAPRVVTALARRLPGSELVTTNTGHLIPIDDPDAVAGAVLRALRCDYRKSTSARPSTGSPI